MTATASPHVDSAVDRAPSKLPQDRSTPGVIPPEIQADIEKFERHLADNLAGVLPDDIFRTIRLAMGMYGQRQGEPNQMIRVKLPWGGITAEQFDALAYISETYSRGWGHLTTRQNVQFHYVQITDVPEVLRVLGRAGMTTREACGDTIRNVMGCHLAGACPYEALDITPWAEAAYRYFVRHPFGQRLPRKFKINFSGCATDCGQAMFNDVGVIGVTQTADDGTTETGFRVFIAGGLGANPHAALALEPFTRKEDLIATIEAVLRVFEQTGNRDNKIRARMKWVVDELGFEEVQRRVLTQRTHLIASATWPGGIPAIVTEMGDAPAGRAADVEATQIGQGTPVAIRSTDPYQRWVESNVVRGAANGTVSAIAWSRLGDLTTDQLRGLARIQAEFGSDVRITNRQNLAFRDLTEEQLPAIYARFSELDMALPGAELSRDVVACPGADTCNLGVTQSRGLADAIGDALDEAGLGEVGGIRTNISGCTNSCGQHHVADIGFHGAERRAHGTSAPGYQMLVGGYVGEAEIQFGAKALRLPAKKVPEAMVRLVGRFAGERQAGELFKDWMTRIGGPKAIADSLSDLDNFPAPSDAPEFYTDFGETGPYAKVLGESECA